jgi:hypothetical protein
MGEIMLTIDAHGHLYDEQYLRELGDILASPRTDLARASARSWRARRQSQLAGTSTSELPKSAYKPELLHESHPISLLPQLHQFAVR